LEPDTPTSQDLAVLVLAHERGDRSDRFELPNAAHRTFEKLNVHLSVRLGSGGYQALLRRAGALAAADYADAVGLHVNNKGDIEGSEAIEHLASITDTAVVVLARLIDLLDTFIGRELTLRVLHAAWPKSVGVDSSSGSGEING